MTGWTKSIDNMDDMNTNTMVDILTTNHARVVDVPVLMGDDMTSGMGDMRIKHGRATCYQTMKNTHMNSGTMSATWPTC